MEGIILAVSPTDKPAKKLWQSVFLKLDDITAKLVAFTDRSQFCVQWSVPLVGADIATPVPGEPNHGVNVDETPFCFYVRSPTEIAGDESCHYLAAPSDAVKKQWVAALLQIAKHGPREPRFATMQLEHDFSFRARVVKFRIHEEGKHAEYMVTCSCQVFSKLVARRLSKQWNYHRDAFRSLLGKALEHEFLEERRLQLDTGSLIPMMRRPPCLISSFIY
uniref:PH domain-containing protein n=1 Tax=Globisporangium ultimum (strain ATCC 200006 / CBS 805.95 / DAOM BR144) TaxID=431595 RepID=K3X4C9_GLOUD